MAKVEDPEQRRRVKAVCVSGKKGEKKKPVESIQLVEGFGIKGDAHAGSGRPVSLLAWESIEKMIDKGLKIGFGDFAENIVTEGMNLPSLPIGSRIKLGKDAELEIIQIGKVCHDRCAIYYQAGDCVMPKEGVFAKVIAGGEIKDGDRIQII